MKKVFSLSHEMIHYWIHPALINMTIAVVAGAVLRYGIPDSVDGLHFDHGPTIWYFVKWLSWGLTGSLIASVLMGAFVATLRERHL